VRTRERPRRIGWEIAAIVVGFLIGFALTHPLFCVKQVNGAANTECQNLLLMTFSGPIRTVVGVVGGMAGAIILWFVARLIGSRRQQQSAN
jgi:hypothetical protein